MTRKEAIRLLSGLMFKGKLKEALDVAIKALEQEPTTKNNLGVDAVSRAEVLKLMQDNWHTHNGDWAMQESMDDIRALPSIYPKSDKPIRSHWHGHWIDCDKNDDYSADGYDCSVCGVNAEYATSYCPNCGAKMDGEEQTDEL